MATTPYNFLEVPVNSHNSHVEISQWSRDQARVPTYVMLERLNNERERLCQEKKQLEAKLADVESWKAERALDITRRNLPKHAAIQATQQLEVEFNSKRRGLSTEIRAIDERLMSIKARRRAKANNADDSLVAVMLRVERLLQKLVDAACERK